MGNSIVTAVAPAIALRPQGSGGLWRWWFAANVVAWSAGLVLSSRAPFLFGVVMLAGFAQWAVLRRYLARLDWWLVANALVWSGSLVLSCGGLFLFGVVAVFAGIAQWLVPRHRPERIDWWLPATVGGGLAGLPWLLVTLNDPHARGPYPEGVIVGGGLLGAALGTAQGLIVWCGFLGAALSGDRGPLPWRDAVRAGCWILASTGACLPLWPVYRSVFLAVDALTGPAPLRALAGYGAVTPLAVATWLLQGAACGAVYAAVTAPALVRLAPALRAPGPSST